MWKGDNSVQVTSDPLHNTQSPLIQVNVASFTLDKNLLTPTNIWLVSLVGKRTVVQTSSDRQWQKQVGGHANFRPYSSTMMACVKVLDIGMKYCLISDWIFPSHHRLIKSNQHNIVTGLHAAFYRSLFFCVHDIECDTPMKLLLWL